MLTCADRQDGAVTTFCPQDSSTFDVTFSDDNEGYAAEGREDDGADETIISSRIAQYAVLNVIGKMIKLPPITLQVALKYSSDGARFSFSRTWTALRTVLKLTSGPLALLNLQYLVADADLDVEDLLLGLPVLRHLGVDTKTVLEERRDLLDGSN